VKAIGSGRPRAGYRILRLRARTWLSGLISGDDGTIDQDFVTAIAELSFPGVRPQNAAQVITSIADVPRSPPRR
jgi:hypothetical protein